jgi:hypothetical protein
MGTPTPHDSKSATRAREQATSVTIDARRKADREHLPSSAHAVDAMLDSVAGDRMRVPGAVGPATPAAHTEGQIQQFGAIQNAIFDMVAEGGGLALRAIEHPEVPPQHASALGDLLALAASLAMAGSAGSIAVWLARGIASRVEQKFVEDTVKDVVKRAFASRPARAPRNLVDLKDAFNQQLVLERANIRNRFASEWSQTYERLSVLPPAELQAVLARASSLITQDSSEVILEIADHTLIAWTNFLAQARYGGMAGWDFWEKNGGKNAIALQGAAKAPERVSEDPTRSNVDPRAMGPSLDMRQRPMQDEHVGILEVFVDTLGHLVAHPDYGMRLDKVGPAVRARLAQLGRVRDLKVNKVIRVCSARINPPVPLASILITADGYVRDADWSNYQTMTIRNHEPLGVGRLIETHDCMTDLIHGRQTTDCHLNPEVDAKAIATVAERAQNLPLTLLEA